MSIPKFDPKELKVVRELPGYMRGMPNTPVYDFPVPRKEAYIATMKRKPVWLLNNVETLTFNPRIIPDNVCRAFVMEANKLERKDFGGKDMFGIEWEYVDVAGGSTVKPGTPTLLDANDWKEKIVWPDLDSYDWEGTAKANEEFLKTDALVITTIFTGFFERLISFMDFENAALAMIDEEQQDAVKAIYNRIADLYIGIVDKFIEYFPVMGGFLIHDDWGSQAAPFFSPDTINEMLVPAMRKLTDHIHSKGRYAEFHSCGKIEKQVPNMIACGWDSWAGMTINDSQMLYDVYGDKIIIGVTPDPFDPATTSEEQQRAEAKKFVDKFCLPGKPCIVNRGAREYMTNVFREELYKQSRIKYSQE